jgi:putative FmdB family regulatory protein
MLYYDYSFHPEDLFLPLYEYLCQKCGHRFEKIENHTASDRKKCPKCGATAERMLAPPAIQFKGSGWYVTDYARRSGGAAGEAKKGDSADGGGKAEAAKTESAAKKETKKGK